jgi:hypothetical protein
VRPATICRRSLPRRQRSFSKAVAPCRCPARHGPGQWMTPHRRGGATGQFLARVGPTTPKPIDPRSLRSNRRTGCGCDRPRAAPRTMPAGADGTAGRSASTRSVAIEGADPGLHELRPRLRTHAIPTRGADVGTAMSSLHSVGIQRVPDLADEEDERGATSGMRPLHVARPSREGRDVGERRLSARGAASPALPGPDAEPVEPGDTVGVQASWSHAPLRHRPRRS